MFSTYELVIIVTANWSFCCSCKVSIMVELEESIKIAYNLFKKNFFRLPFAMNTSLFWTLALFHNLLSSKTWHSINFDRKRRNSIKINGMNFDRYFYEVFLLKVPFSICNLHDGFNFGCTTELQLSFNQLIFSGTLNMYACVCYTMDN